MNARAEPDPAPRRGVRRRGNAADDIAMPGEDGYATLKRIRAWEGSRGGARAKCPAVALSAYAQREDRMRALAEGFQMHLTKPVAPAELINLLSSVVRGLRT